jgi:hypothetical protein
MQGKQAQRLNGFVDLAEFVPAEAYLLSKGLHLPPAQAPHKFSSFIVRFAGPLARVQLS